MTDLNTMYSAHSSTEYPTMHRDSSRQVVHDDMPPPYTDIDMLLSSRQRLYDDFRQPTQTVQETSKSDRELPYATDDRRPSEHTTQPETTNRATPSRLSKIIAIPATSPDVGSPFLRSYPPVLMDYNMPKESFLAFLDKLNRVTVKAPPLAVLDAAGTLVSFVPLHTAQIVGSSIGAASKIGAIALSKGQTELFLRESNAQIFNPRGLKAEIAKLEAVARIANMPILDEEGKLDKRAPLLQPIDSIEQVHSISAQQRRLGALQPYTAHLDLTPLPDIEEPTNILSQLSMKASERQRRKEEEKILENRAKQVEKNLENTNKAMKDYKKEMAKLEKDRMKVERKESGSKYEKEMAKLEKERQKIEKEFEKETGKDKKKDKEEKNMRTILWLVIRDVNAESEVVGPNPDM